MMTGIFVVLSCMLPVLADPISLWEIDGQHGSVYLLGSVHALRPALYPLAPEIDAAFDKSDITVFEVDLSSITGEDRRMMRQQAIYPPPLTLESELSSDTLKQVKQYLSANELRFSDYMQMRPWFLSLQIGILELTKLGYKPELGIDIFYQEKARRAGKPILQLETFSEQINFLSADSAPVQEISLRSSLAELTSLDSTVDDLMQAWSIGAADQMYELSAKSSLGYPELKQQLNRLLDERNTRMAKKINRYLQSTETYFVVIGALHMGGPKGILALLRKDHRIEQLHHSGE